MYKQTQRVVILMRSERIGGTWGANKTRECHKEIIGVWIAFFLTSIARGAFGACPSPIDVYLAWGSYQGGEDLRISVDGVELGSLGIPECDPNINYDDCFTRDVSQPWDLPSSHTVSLTLYPLVDGYCSYNLWSVDPFSQFFSTYFTTTDCVAAVVPDVSNPPYLPYQGGIAAYQSIPFIFHLVGFRLLDAQGFQPQWQTGSPPTLNLPITTELDPQFERIGALTDGASLVIIQVLGGQNLQGFTLQLTDEDVSTNGAEQLGSLWHGDNNNLPPLPATAGAAGSSSLVLDGTETAVFYRPPAAWWFGSDRSEKTIRIELYSPTGGWMCSFPFVLHKPPLVLVHGYKGKPSNWGSFTTVLANNGIEADSFRADYEANNTAGLDTVFDSVPTKISEALNAYRTNSTGRIAATRVDVVAHSLGGVVTRWYMTPSASLPNNVDRGLGASPPLQFKVTKIKGTRPPEFEFLREDNFGIGDIRRFITLGTPHTGTSAAWRAIRLLNQWVSGRAYRNRELLNDALWVETTLNFHALGLSDPGTPTEAGMVIVDAAAFGTHPTSGLCGGCPQVSLALSSLPPVQVQYLPVEGTAFNNNVIWDALVWIGQRAIALRGPPPRDLEPDVSDGFIPTLSARNRTVRRPQYNLTGVHHGQLTYASSLGPILQETLVEDESMFLP